MNILILNGSPRRNGNTSFMVNAFKEGAEKTGHDVTVLNVGALKIGGCLGCEYCHNRGHGQCIQKDDQEQVYEAIKKADLLVLASPIYYFMMSSYLEASIQRMHAFGIPGNIKKTALILTSGSNGVYDAAISQYHMIFQDYMGLEDMGVCTAYGMQNKSEEKKIEMENLGASLKN